MSYLHAMVLGRSLNSIPIQYFCTFFPMSTSFSSLPIVSLSALSSPEQNEGQLLELSSRLDEVFSTTGFAYLTDLLLTYTHDDVFGLCDNFFGVNGVSGKDKMQIAKKTFVKSNKNTYRGHVSLAYIPVQN